jgi:hypothetical protein
MPLNENLGATKREYSQASTGIRSPRVATLPAGQAIFRFASTTNPKTGQGIPSTEWAKSPWWFLEADYHKILARHRAGALALGTVARSAAAVQPSWSRMDVSIKAYLRFDTEVYLGKGKTQYCDLLPNGMYMTLSGWSDVDQIYIPGLRGSATHAMQIIRQKRIGSDGFGY